MSTSPASGPSAAAGLPEVAFDGPRGPRPVLEVVGIGLGETVLVRGMDA